MILIGKWFFPLGLSVMLLVSSYNLGYHRGRNIGIHDAFVAFKEVLQKAEENSKYTEI